MVLASHGVFDTPEFWGFMSIVVAQVTGIILLLLNGRKIRRVETHVNNVEEDINHGDVNISLGQRLKRVERSLDVFIRDSQQQTEE